MVLAGAKSDALIWLLLPTSMASAIVSPMARPRARMAAPKMPLAAIGREICRITSQRVAPRAAAPSLRACGVVLSAEPESAAMVGRIMMDRTKAAGKKPGPDEGVEKRGNHPMCALSQLPSGVVIGIITKMPHKP